jgi:hypothetical protein
MQPCPLQPRSKKSNIREASYVAPGFAFGDHLNKRGLSSQAIDAGKSNLIVPSPYSGSRDVSSPAGNSVVNRSSDVEIFTENYDRSSILIRNPSLCENKDYFEHKMYQQRFTSHVLGAQYPKTIVLRDWGLKARLSMVYRKNIQNFTQAHNVTMVMH